MTNPIKFDPLADFLYVLMRDELPAGAVERVLRQAEETSNPDRDDFPFNGTVSYCNELLYQLAAQCAGRIRSVKTEAENK